MIAWVFDLDPVLIDFGPVQIRWYGLMFVVTLAGAFWFWRRQMLRGGHSAEVADQFLVWGVAATFIGARLGHYLFYEPQRFVSDPLSILYIWQGGLASHGATIGLAVALVLFARKRRLSVLEVTDRFAMSAAVGAAGIRLGNFLNSEIVGRVTGVPWAVEFTHYQVGPGVFENPPQPRHPSQLYEFALGLFVLGVLCLADRWAGGEKRRRGMMSGLFLTVYFAGRFCVEYVKEYQIGPWESVLTMGQILSIVPFLAGVALLVWTWRKQSAPAPIQAPTPPVKRRKGCKRKRR